MTSSKGRTLHLAFAQDGIDRLDKLKELTEAATYAEVVANAVRLYEGIINIGGQNAKLVVHKDDGTVTFFRLFE